MLFDAGQLFGGFAAGYITDKMGVRSPIVAFMLLASSGIVYLYKGASIAGISVLLIVSGVLLGGPSNLISACIAGNAAPKPSCTHTFFSFATHANVCFCVGYFYS
jgi:sugar phosphate permease